jgi:hypothetical protein
MQPYLSWLHMVACTWQHACMHACLLPCTGTHVTACTPACTWQRARGGMPMAACSPIAPRPALGGPRHVTRGSMPAPLSGQPQPAFCRATPLAATTHLSAELVVARLALAAVAAAVDVGAHAGAVPDLELGHLWVWEWRRRDRLKIRAEGWMPSGNRLRQRAQPDSL